MDKTNRDLHSANREAWDITAAIYERDEADLVARFRSGGNTLFPQEIRILQDLKEWCQVAIHLQCAGGADALSLWKLGAANVIGIDISEKMVSVAQRITQALEAPASWYCCDVLDTPHDLNGTADLVYTGRGALPWITNIEAWASVIARLLKPRGKVFIFEGHPLDWVWDMQADCYQFSSLTGNYFSRAIISDRGWPLFSDPIQEHCSKEQLHVYERQWTLGDILNNLVAVDLRLVRFDEYPDLFWNQFPQIPSDLINRLPHTFSLLMQKA